MPTIPTINTSPNQRPFINVLARAYIPDDSDPWEFYPDPDAGPEMTDSQGRIVRIVLFTIFGVIGAFLLWYLVESVWQRWLVKLLGKPTRFTGHDDLETKADVNVNVELVELRPPPPAVIGPATRGEEKWV